MKALLLSVGLAFCTAAWADCKIDDPEQTDDGIQGMCSNNGERVECKQGDNGWTCNGPHGEYSSTEGSDVGPTLRLACGCHGVGKLRGDSDSD